MDTSVQRTTLHGAVAHSFGWGGEGGRLGGSSFRSREGMDRRIGVLGVSLGGCLAVALGMGDRRMPGGAFVLV